MADFYTALPQRSEAHFWNSTLLTVCSREGGRAMLRPGESGRQHYTIRAIKFIFTYICNLAPRNVVIKPDNAEQAFGYRLN